MHKQMTLVLATLAMSAAAFAQTNIWQDGPYQVGFAANLNIGDSEVNLSNDGVNGGFYTGTAAGVKAGNICANVYVFDPSEEEVACCYCLVTPNGLNSLSAKADLISDTLTPAVPQSIVIKIVGSTPASSATAPFGVCNPATVTATTITNGLLAWGATLEPNGASTYGVVNVPFLKAHLSTTAGGPNELSDLTSVCAFVISQGTGFGQCKSCGLGALAGGKH
jgi:hypothetical protein